VDEISPELALVDDELVRSARDRLPDAPDCLTPLEDRVAGTPSDPRRRGSKRLLAGLALLLASATLGAVELSRGSGPDTAIHSSPPTAGQAPPLTHRHVELRWRPVRGAAFYNVIFWRNGVRALDLWPKAATVRLPESRLPPGRYQWFVYPALGKGAERGYGRVAARGTIRL
jgi:hypothetical protein